MTARLQMHPRTACMPHGKQHFPANLIISQAFPSAICVSQSAAVGLPYLQMLAGHT